MLVVVFMDGADVRMIQCRGSLPFVLKAAGSLRVSLPRSRKTNSYEVTLENEKLQRGFIWTFTPLYVAFDSWELAKSFSIDYAIYAGNMIDEQTGKLGVVVIEKI